MIEADACEEQWLYQLDATRIEINEPARCASNATLGMPRFIIPSIQGNIRRGNLPAQTKRAASQGADQRALSVTAHWIRSSKQVKEFTNDHGFAKRGVAGM
jgi:hypothetical protein